ncbi:hypothetical protein PaG_03801 [Moesziomyces aphidis]|uniref:Cleavage and polyadenylation specificity factor subunit 2 n=1 Tax=Moesziomyces aphidis TaxID=84754 RepID=W3VL23_MOEAP|nr:hypothetical protein PaG_03801 [Moesziomyces aphidis]
MITFVPLSVPYAAAAGSETSVRTKLDLDAGQQEPQEEEHPRALAYLLQMDDVRVLIDCGSPEDFFFSGASKLDLPTSHATGSSDDQAESSSMAQQRDSDSASLDLSQLKAAPLDTLLRELAPTIDLVLLSHSSLDHLGLYAYAYAKLGLRCLVYATMPVQSMGKLTVLEATQTWRNEVDIDAEEAASNKAGSLASKRRCLATTAEIEDAFEHIKTVRYMQPTHLEGKCASLTLTAYNAGHSLGGAIWKIRSPTSGTVVVALDWNHNRERHLDGTILLSSSAAGPGMSSSGSGADAVRRPDLLITEIERGLVVNTRRKDRDAAIIDLVHKTIQSGHSVLFPIDGSARLLELMVLLDQHWAYAYPHARFPLCLISRTGKEVIERSRTYMEWMTREWATKANETIEADKDRQPDAHRAGRGARNAAASSPLDFKYVRVFASLQQMDEAIPQDQARVVLAVPPSMTHGPSRRLLARFARNPNDAIVLISRGEPGSLCRQLWDAWNLRQPKGFSWTKGKLGEVVSGEATVRYELQSKVPLEGEELRLHLESEQAERDRLAQQRALLARSRRRLEADEDDSSDSDSDSDGGQGEGEDIYDVARSGAAEPGGELIRKRPYGTAFAESGGVGGGGNAAGAGQGADTNQLSFDIYLKGNASRATSFFGSKAGQEGPFGLGVRYRLFPAIERKRLVDGFGEVVDVARWLSRRRALEAAESAAADPLSASPESAALAAEANRKKLLEEEAKAQAAVPSKFVSELIEVVLACRLAFVEMSGLNDGRALKTLIPQLHPRRLIMVNGDAPTRADMRSVLQAIKTLTHDVHAPAWMQHVQIGEVTNAYTLTLGEGLLAQLEMSRFEEFEVAHVRALVKAAGDAVAGAPVLETEASLAEDAEEGSEQAQARVLVELADEHVLRPVVHDTIEAEAEAEVEAEAETDGDAEPVSNRAALALVQRGVHAGRLDSAAAASAAKLPGTLFIGDLKLSTLKSALAASPFRVPAEFAGEGMLVCAPASSTAPDAVTVQKHAKGKIVIEGNVTRNFRTVRNAVYALHASVASSAPVDAASK